MPVAMGVGSGGMWHPWIFIRGTDKVEKGLMMLFFGLVFFRWLPPLPWKIFCRRPCLLLYSTVVLGCLSAYVRSEAERIKVIQTLLPRDRS